LGHCRAVKSDEEIDALRMATRITCEAHIEVMRKIKPGMREKQFEAVFKHYGEFNYFTGRV
jgi:Xaa-Pro dipeptidase